MLIVSQKIRKGRGFYWSFILGVCATLFVQVSLFIFIFLNYDFIRNYAFQKGYLGVGEHGISKHVKSIPTNILSFLSFSSELETWVVDIDFEEYEKLRSKVVKSRVDGFIQQSESDWVKATITDQDIRHKVKLRIKGDNLDHLQGDKWSLRIKSKTSIDGLRHFNIQNPIVRGFYGPKILERLRIKYGLIATETTFKKVIINGKDIGIMQIEEHFAKELLERNRRKETVILKFDEQNLWDYGEYYDFEKVHIDTFGTSKVVRDPVKWDMYSVAWELLDDFVNQRKAPGQVFDCVSTGYYLALNRLMGANHGHRWGNLRFYFNPYLEKLEIIGFDDNFQERMPANTPAKTFFNNKFVSTVWSDPEIQKCYKVAASKIVSDFNDDVFISDLNANIAKTHNALKREFYLLPKFSIKNLARDHLDVFPFLGPKEPTVDSDEILDIKYQNGPPALLRYDPVRNRAIVRNLINIPIEVTGLAAMQTSKLWKKLVKPVEILEPFDEVVLFNDPGSSTDYIELKLDLKQNGVKKSISSNFGPVKLGDESQLFADTDVEQLSLYGKLDHDVFTFRTGNIEIPKTLRFTKKKITVPQDSVLLFQNGAGLDLSGKTELSGGGTIKGNGVDSGWLILDAHQKEATVSGITFLSPGLISIRENWFTGSIMLHNSNKLLVNDLIINEVNNEDALNIVNSKFTITNFNVSNTKSDALDIDFSEGQISKSFFNDIGYMSGADAIDLSGSKVNINNIVIENVSDKGFSIGENSIAQINDSQVTNALVGVASKDGSRVKVTETKFSNIKLAHVMAYIKKDVYNQATAIVENVTQRLKIICDNSSMVIVNEYSCVQEELDIDELYKTFMKTSRGM